MVTLEDKAEVLFVKLRTVFLVKAMDRVVLKIILARIPIKCSRVDLPAPEGPMMETNSPSFTAKLTRRKTKVLVGPASKYFSTFTSRIMGKKKSFQPSAFSDQPLQCS
jgi:hypothetical protein